MSTPADELPSYPQIDLRALRPRDSDEAVIGGQFDATVPERSSGPFRYPPVQRRRWLPLILFIATCASTFFAGALEWNPLRVLVEHPEQMSATIAANWRQGLVYAGAVIGILLMHEMGHFLQTIRYGVPASYPIFLPLPIMPTGTMGAVIGMEGSRADRRQLFDIAITGPWAGLAVALPVIWFGVKHASVAAPPSPEATPLGHPWIFDLMQAHLRPDLPPGASLAHNALTMAGWVGMLVTGLNMLPVSQLDGGHVIYGLFGRRAHWIARAFVIVTIGFILVTELYHWIVMLVLVLSLGVDHPPTRDDRARLGWPRKVLGLVSLAIPIFCFTPFLV